MDPVRLVQKAFLLGYANAPEVHKKECVVKGEYENEQGSERMRNV